MGWQWPEGAVTGGSPRGRLGQQWGSVRLLPKSHSPLHWMRGTERQGGRGSERFPAKSRTEMISSDNFSHGCLYLEIILEQVRQCLAVP